MKSNNFKRVLFFSLVLLAGSTIFAQSNNTVDITLDPSDTRSFCESFKNGQKTFWYEIELNEEITLIGYDKDGPKLLILYPEAAKTITSV